MSSSPLKTFLIRFRIPLILLAIVLVLLFAFLASPYSPTHLCTLMGCFDSLELSLVVEPPQEYTVKVIDTCSGETRSVTCEPGKYKASYPYSTSNGATCNDGIVTFLGFDPGEVNIEIAWQTGDFFTVGQPAYESFRPNGRNCPPECRQGKLLVDLYQG